MKAPFSWPKRIPSARPSGSAPQFTATNGSAERGLPGSIALANHSFPVPDSPSTRTECRRPTHLWSAWRPGGSGCRLSSSAVNHGRRVNTPRSRCGAIWNALRRRLSPRLARGVLPLILTVPLGYPPDRPCSGARRALPDDQVPGRPSVRWAGGSRGRRRSSRP